MSDEPERIWVTRPTTRRTEYVRADLAPSPTPDVQITEEMVERAALAIFKAWYGDEEGWASVWHLARPGHMEQARAALTAALATTGGTQ